MSHLQEGSSALPEKFERGGTHLENVSRSRLSMTVLGLTSSYHGRSCSVGQVATLGVPVTLKMTSSW